MRYAERLDGYARFPDCLSNHRHNCLHHNHNSFRLICNQPVCKFLGSIPSKLFAFGLQQLIDWYEHKVIQVETFSLKVLKERVLIPKDLFHFPEERAITVIEKRTACWRRFP